MDFALTNALIRRGAIYLIHQVNFGDITKPKYVILLENNCRDKEKIIGVFTTSNLDYHYLLSTVLVETSKCSIFPEDTLIECENCHEFPVSLFINNAKAEYLGAIGEDYLEEIYEAFEHTRCVSEEFLIRIFP